MIEPMACWTKLERLVADICVICYLAQYIKGLLTKQGEFKSMFPKTKYMLRSG